MTALTILLVGLLLGMQHATEADHLGAVATLATRQSTLAQALGQGAAWGLGHTLTLMAFGGAVLLLGQVISEDLERALESAVGVMLVLLGIDVLRRLARERLHAPVHHRHRPADGAWPLRALLVGMVHGLAGSAALVILSLKTTPSIALGLGYIAVFGLGSIVGMALLSAAIALPLRLSARRLAGLHRAMTALVGAFSCGIGVWMLWETGWLQAQLAA